MKSVVISRVVTQILKKVTTIFLQNIIKILEKRKKLFKKQKFEI